MSSASTRDGAAPGNAQITQPPNGLALAALMIGAFMPPLDFFIVNLALPEIGKSLGATSSELQLVVSAYACAFSVFLVTGGRLGDLYGRKRIFMLGMAGFVAASALCAHAGAGWVLVTSRILQGLAAAAMVPQVLATIRTVFVPSQQTKVMSLYGFIIGIAAVAGQLGGGALVTMRPFGLGWPAIFLINVPIGLAALWGVWRYVPENQPPKGARIDWPGTALLSLFLFLLLYPLSHGRELGWPLRTWTMLAGSLPVFVLWLGVERRLAGRGADPLVDLTLFSNPIFSLSLLLTFLFYFDSAFFLTYGILLQDGFKWSPWEAGLAILPFGMGTILGSACLPVLTKRLGNRVLPSGFTALAVGLWLSAVGLSGMRTPTPLLYAGLLVAGCGHGLVLPTVTRMSISEVSPSKAGLASGITTSVLQLGAAFGAAIVSGVFFARLGDRGPEAHVHAYRITMFVLAGIFVVCVGLSTLLIRAQARQARQVRMAGWDA